MARLYDLRWWRRYAKRYLVQHPWCLRCKAAGRGVVRAQAVDHITPHEGNMQLFRDPANHQSLCHDCHNEKTAREDGAFGRAPSRVAQRGSQADGMPIDPGHPWQAGGR